MKPVDLLIKPKEVTLTDQDGLDHTYIVSRFDAILGRELVAKYPIANLPKLGDYGVSEEVMFKLMSCVAAKQPDGKFIVLETRELYKNFVPDWEIGMKIEGAAWEHNCSFFGQGKALSFFADIKRNSKEWITSILTDLLAQSSAKAKPPFTN